MTVFNSCKTVWAYDNVGWLRVEPCKYSSHTTMQYYSVHHLQCRIRYSFLLVAVSCCAD